MYETIVGLGAATLTTISFVPQVIKVLRTRNVKGISLVMYVIFCSGVLLWLIYGILVRDAPVIAANAITLVLASVVLYYRIKLS